MRHPLRLLALLLSLAIVAAACSSSDGPSIAQSGDAGFVTTTTTVEAAKAIITLSPTATEMLFAIDAGNLVIAADAFSNFPANAPTTDLSGFDPNIEAILGFEPDLVVLSGDRNDVVAGLAAADVQTLILPSANNFDEIYAQIEILGDVTGNDAEADALVAQMKDDIAKLVADVPERDEALTYYHELDNTLFTATSSTFIGEVYGLFGLDNIADAADPAGESFGFPQLSAEFLLEADPDLVFLACTVYCDETAQTFGSRDGFGAMTAVVEGNIAELNDDVVSRWGPRIVDFATQVADLTSKIDATA